MPCCTHHSLLECHTAGEVEFSEVSTAIEINKGFATANAKPSYAPNQRISPSHMAITLDATEAALKAKTIQAKLEITLTVPTSTISPTTITRELSLNAVALNITSVAGCDSFAYDGKHLHLRWTENYTGGVVTIHYTIETPIAGLYFHVPDALVPDRALHVITDHETERARYWLPCVDFPLVRTTLEFIITHSNHHVAVANGAHVSTTASTADPSTSVSVYQLLKHTCPSYLVCWAVGDFVQVDDGEVDGMHLKYLCSRDNKFVTPENLMRTFGKTGAMVRWMEKKVGFKFPWEKYYQIVSPKIEGGAMENISLVTYKDVFLLNEELGKDGWQAAVDGVNVHEMAHTYFGDLLTIRHFEHAWLKESWATYMDYCWSEDHYSHEEARYESLLNMEGYISETSRYVRPIVCRTYDSSWDMFDGHTYPGGAFRIHMLRNILGNDTFWAAIKNYIHAFNGRYVETEDFKRCLEKESGLNLTKFFDQWVYGRGYPKIKAEYAYDADKQICQITLEQTQENKELDIPAVFELSLEVDVIDADGRVHPTEVHFSDATGPKVVAFVAMGSAKVDVVEVDPRGKVLHSLDFNPGEAVLEATAKKGRDVMSRIRAFRQLIKIGSISSLKKVSSSIHNEMFWGVRAQVYLALSESKLQAAVDILANALALEKDPQSLRVLAVASSPQDSRIRQGLLNLLEHPNELLSGRTRRFAFTNLGRQRNPADVEFLLTAAKTAASNPDIHAHTLTGIITGMGLHRTPETFAALLEMVFTNGTARPIPESCAVIAVDAIAASVVWQESKILRREVAEKLALLVRADPAHRVQKAAVRALVAMGEDGKQHFGVCHAVAATAFAEQDTLKLVTRVKGMQGGGEAAGDKELKAKVEDLEGRLKKMEGLVLLMEAKEKSGLFVEEGAK
ncbi:hypothetical protein HDU98_010273 [Podochytrium sp. JEL0797]|nr:hypothetical protein HDU98_010273 [Podochytrium sp. JEL0797]